MSLSRRAMAGTCTILALLVAPAGCGKIKQADPQAATKARAAAKRQQAACGSAIAYDRLKGLVFDLAQRDRGGDSTALDALADYSFVRVDNPVVESWDPELEITHCSGRLVLEMPAGVRRAFGGEHRLQADIDYTAQAAADGKGHVYAIAGAGPMAARLAGFNLTSRTYQPPPAIDQAAADDADAVETADVADVGADTTVPLPRRAPEPVPVPAPQQPRAAVPVQRQVAAPVRAPEAPDRAPTTASPHAPRGDGGEASVRAFYAALGAGDGDAASARIIPEKRAGRAFSPNAISRFYGRLPQPLRLIAVEPVARNVFRATYRYSAGRSKCNGTALVRTVDRDGETLIRSIDAQNGC